MIEKNFSIWDYAVFGGLLVVSTLIGIFFAWRGRKNPSSDDFFTGNRRLGLFPVTLSLVVSFLSTNTLLGVPAEVFQVGTQYIMQNISICIGLVLAAEVFMPVYHDLGITSVNEYLMKRFNSNAVKLVGTVGLLVYMMPYLAAVLYGPAAALSSVTPLSIPVSVLVVGSICAFYTSIGGIKAVIWTDVLQCFLMVLGCAIVVIYGLIELGGFSNAMRITEEGGRLKFFNFKFDIYNHDNFWNVFLLTTLDWTATYSICQSQIQRYCGMKDKRTARKTIYYNIPGLLLLATLSIMTGVVIYGKYHDCDPVRLGIVKRHDQLVPYYVMDTMQKFPGIPGLFVACCFSGSLSTLSSGFNAMAAVTWEDLIKNRFTSISSDTKKTMRAIKLIAFGYGLLAIAMSFVMGRLGTVMQASMKISGGVQGPLFGLFSSAILFPFVNVKGALTGFTAGVSVSLFLSLGSMVYPKANVCMPTTYDHCPVDVAEHYLNTTLHTIPKFDYVPYYENPQGIERILHVSYLLVSVIGFIVSISTCMIVSALTGRAGESAKLDDSLFSPVARYFFKNRLHKQNNNGEVSNDSYELPHLKRKV